MPIKGQIIIMLFAFAMLIFVLELLRRRKINAATTLWWLFIILSTVFLTLNQRVMNYITSVTGAAYPISALILLSLFFVLLMLIYFSMKISVLSNQIKEMAQYISILKNEIDTEKDKEEIDACE